MKDLSLSRILWHAATPFKQSWRRTYWRGKGIDEEVTKSKLKTKNIRRRLDAGAFESRRWRQRRKQEGVAVEQPTWRCAQGHDCVKVLWSVDNYEFSAPRILLIMLAPAKMRLEFRDNSEI